MPAVSLPTTRASLFDPPPELAAIRESQEPICRLRFTDGHVGWLVTRYDDARAMLLDQRFSVRPFRLPVGDSLDGIAQEGSQGLEFARARATMVAGGVINLDPPDHTRLRRLQRWAWYQSPSARMHGRSWRPGATAVWLCGTFPR